MNDGPSSLLRESVPLIKNARHLYDTDSLTEDVTWRQRLPYWK